MKTKKSIPKHSGAPLIIAHRGASGYLPEHTLPAKALAYAMGADFLEQDVVASRDGALLVLHDLYLEALTNVANLYPGRARPDGHFYCIDFDLAEIRTLSVSERIDPADGETVYPGRFPRSAGQFPVCTFSEELEFIRGLNQATGRDVGVYPELKHPGWHRKHGIDLAQLMLDCLQSAGYLKPQANIFLQCLDTNELRRIRQLAGAEIKLVQLLNSRWQPDQLSLQEINSYAQCIGPSVSLILKGVTADGEPILSTLVEEASGQGLRAHPYTFRVDALPQGITGFESLLDIFIDRLRVDGLFTDFPDRIAAYLQNRR